MINSTNEYEPGLLNTFNKKLKITKFYKECTSSLAPLPPREFAVFERQFPHKYYTQRAKNLPCTKFY